MFNCDEFIRKYSNLTESYWFYGHSVELRFDTEAHVYYLVKDGEFIEVPSVTSIVKIIDKSGPLMAWACKMMYDKILDEIPLLDGKVIVTFEDFTRIIFDAKSAHSEILEDAGDVGHSAHRWIEKYIINKLNGNHENPEFPNDERVVNCCKAMLEWEKKHNVRFLCTERKIYSKEFQYAGTFDAMALVDGCGGVCCGGETFKNRKSLIDWKSSNHLYLEYCLQVAAYLKALLEEYGTT